MYYDEEAHAYLKKMFGTSIIGNCKKCDLADKNRNRYTQLMCGHDRCLMYTKLELFKSKRESKEALKSGEQFSGLERKLSKLRILGFEEDIITPWLLMRDEKSENVVWFLPKLGVYNSKLYKGILVQGTMIICITDYIEYAEGVVADVEVYSSFKGKQNLVDGIPDIKYNISKTGLQWNSYKASDILSDYVICNAKDKSSGIMLSVIVSQYGDRLAVPYDELIHIESYGNKLIINLHSSGGKITTTSRLDVERLSVGTIAIKL